VDRRVPGTVLVVLALAAGCDARAERSRRAEPGMTVFTRVPVAVGDRPLGGEVVVTVPAGRQLTATCYVRSARDAYKRLTVRVTDPVEGWVGMLAGHDAFTVGPSAIRAGIAVCGSAG